MTVDVQNRATEQHDTIHGRWYAVEVEDGIICQKLQSAILKLGYSTKYDSMTWRGALSAWGRYVKQYDIVEHDEAAEIAYAIREGICGEDLVERFVTEGRTFVGLDHTICYSDGKRMMAEVYCDVCGEANLIEPEMPIFFDTCDASFRAFLDARNRLRDAPLAQNEDERRRILGIPEQTERKLLNGGLSFGELSDYLSERVSWNGNLRVYGPEIRLPLNEHSLRSPSPVWEI